MALCICTMTTVGQNITDSVYQIEGVSITASQVFLKEEAVKDQAVKGPCY